MLTLQLQIRKCGDLIAIVEMRFCQVDVKWDNYTSFNPSFGLLYKWDDIIEKIIEKHPNYLLFKTSEKKKTGQKKQRSRRRTKK